nr:hypothetical protein [Tanacetum cinerariifolium]
MVLSEVHNMWKEGYTRSPDTQMQKPWPSSNYCLQDNFHLWRRSGTQQTLSPKTKFPQRLKPGVMASGKDVVLRYVAVACWRPAFNVHRDHRILVVQFLVSEIYSDRWSSAIDKQLHRVFYFVDLFCIWVGNNGLTEGVMTSGKDVVLRYVAVAWWRPAFNVHRDNVIGLSLFNKCLYYAVNDLHLHY